MEFECFRLQKEELETYINYGKNIILIDLLNKGLINEEIFNEYSNYYAFIIKYPSFFGKIWQKITNENQRLILVKTESMHEEELQDNPPKLKVLKIPSKEDKT